MFPQRTLVVRVRLHNICVCPLVSCQSASISGPVSYTIPSPSTLGTFMGVSYDSPLVWSTTPALNSLNATCSNVSGSGSWLIGGNPSCVGNTLLAPLNQN